MLLGAKLWIWNCCEWRPRQPTLS